ncbi:MAG: MFS transporter, partial [Chloroflexota bacterium]
SWGGHTYPWGSAQINGLFALAAVMLVAFVAVERWQARRGGEPVLPLELFREPIYAVGVLTTVIIGFGMFGTILYIPLFMQGVLTTSATDSGKVLWPMMFGMLGASIITGQFIQRSGRYKWFGVVGLVVTSGGMLLLSRMSAETGYWTASRNMVVVGAGIGMTFPVFSLAVQNAVPYRVMGIAMSSLQFFRTLGGMMGAAIMGTIMTNAFAPEFEQRAAPALGQLSRAAQGVPPQVLAQLPPQAQAGLQHPATLFANPQILLSPEAMGQLHGLFDALPGGATILEQLLVALRTSLAVALDRVFLIGSGIILIGFVVSLFLGERPLRKTNRPDPEREGVEAIAAPSDTAGVAVEAQDARDAVRRQRGDEDGSAPGSERVAAPIPGG